MYAERIFTNYRGWVDLLDMENVVCRRVDDIVPAGRCTGCFDMEADGFMGPAKVVVEDTWGALINVLEEATDVDYYEAAEYQDYRE